MLITSIWVFFVFGTSARGREKLPLLVGEQFLGNWSESGIPGCISSILVTDGFYTIRYATFFFQRNLLIQAGQHFGYEKIQSFSMVIGAAV